MGPTGLSSLSKKTIMSDQSPLDKRGDWAKLTFAKTSGSVTRDKEKMANS